MTHKVYKRNSLYVQLLKLLVASVAVAIAAFFVFNSISNYLIENYLENSDYVEDKNQQNIAKLQQYINKNNVSTDDTTMLDIWVKEQKVINIRVYNDYGQVYDSEYPDQNVLNKSISFDDYEWESYYKVKFEDGSAEVVITGLYGYQLYNRIFIIDLCLAFGVFLLAVLLGIRKKMKYISVLRDEIEILEGGDLEHPVTIDGKDELSSLAEGLEGMRLSFRNLIESEAEMTKENQRIVTSMSHDLRTPITSIMLYTEILKQGKYRNSDQLKQYIERIDKKAHRMKQLTDNLFEYSLIAGENTPMLEEPESYETIFYDLFSETCNYLNQKGFEIDFRVNWSEDKITISTNYVMRIMDNIASNIVKYADHDTPIIIEDIQDELHIGFIFENKIRKPDKNTESTGIGMQNIKNMMQKMNGECRENKADGNYKLTLLFRRYIDEKE